MNWYGLAYEKTKTLIYEPVGFVYLQLLIQSLILYNLKSLERIDMA